MISGPKLYDKAANILLKMDEGTLLAHLAGLRWRGVVWLDAKMPDYKGLYCDVLGRGTNLDTDEDEGVHCEAQRDNDLKIGERLLTYGGATLKYHGFLPLHLVLYLGAGPCTMPRRFERKQYTIRYLLVSARDRDAEEFYALGTLGAVIFSFLCNIRDRKTYVDKALRRIRELTPSRRLRAHAYNLLGVILQLRDKELQTMVKQNIRAHYAEEDLKIIEGTFLWEFGFEKGVDKGREEGREEGFEKGVEKARRDFILGLKAEGFDDERIARVVGVPVSTVRAVLYPLNGNAEH